MENNVAGSRKSITFLNQANPTTKSDDRKSLAKFSHVLEEVGSLKNVDFKNLSTSSYEMGRQSPRFSSRQGSVANLDGRSSGSPQEKCRHLSFSKRVHVPWYHRYVDILSGDDMLLTQPVEEVAHEELDNAMKMKFGHHYKHMYANELSDAKIRKQMEKTAMKYYRKSKQTTSTNTSVTNAEMNDFEAHMTFSSSAADMQSRRDSSFPEGPASRSVSRVKTQSILNKEDLEQLRKSMRIKKFIRVVNVVMSLNRFKLVLTGNNISIKVMLSELPDLAEKVADDTDQRQNAMTWIFNPFKYKSNQSSKAASLPISSVLTLTKPWHTRSIDEIGEVVKVIYPRLISNKYPIKIQFQIANVAWYTRLYKNRPLFREGNAATCFKILLSGQIVLVELIKNRVVAKGKPLMRIVKVVNKGDRFGDEETEMLYRRRLYSAYTLTTCEILAVDYDDYQENQMIYDPVAESAPPHILFINRLPLLSAISRHDLIRSAKENIQLLYFCNRSFMTKSLNKSDFVFIVMMGECHTVVRHKKTQPKKGGSLSAAKQQRSDSENPVAEVRIPKFHESKSEKARPQNGVKKIDRTTRKFLNDMKDVGGCDFKKTWMTREFVRDIKKISERSLNMTKEKAVQEVKSLRLMRAVGAVYGQEFTQGIAVEIVEKMHVHETANREYEAETQRIKAQTLLLYRRLARSQKEVKSLSKLKETIARAELKGALPVSEEPTTTSLSSHISETKTRPSIVKKTASKHSKITPERQAAIKDVLKQKIRAQATFLTLFKAKNVVSEDDEHLKMVDWSGDLFDTGGNSPAELDTEIHQHAKGNNDRAASKVSEVSRFSLRPQSSSTGPSLRESAATSEDYIETAKHSERPSGESSEEKLCPTPKMAKLQETSALCARESNEPPTDYEWSPPISRYIRGDVIGNEYVNYNDGKFREPEMDCALVSDGVEVVIVRKSFLLERLYNHQRKFNDLIAELEADTYEED